jgi:Na+-transporting methylmalonyl-CoA/oxaloacetate decarboxylase gamma subunit
MQKLKENIFAISVAGIAVVLLALAYLFVWQPLSDLGAMETRLDREITNLKKYDKRKFVPTEEYKERLEQVMAAARSDLEGGEGFYKERQQALSRYFDNEAQPPSFDVFTSRYESSIKEMVQKYRTKFEIAGDEAAQPDLPPAVERFPFDQTQAEKHIPLAMKEFWVAEAVFKACEALNLGGLKSITFPLRLDTKGEALPYHRLVKSEVVIEMPFSQIENLVTRLLATDKVIFQVEDLVMRKDPAALEKFKSLVIKQQYPSAEKAAEASYDSVVPEPGVSVTIKLHAIDWTGMAEAPASDKAAEKKPAGG